MLTVMAVGLFALATLAERLAVSLEPRGRHT